MWFGTNDGLNKYDGNKFTVYQKNSKDTGSISSSRILSILEDKEKNIWIGTAKGGLNLFDRKTESFSSFIYDKHNPNSLSNNNVKVLFEDSKGRLWVGTEGGGLNLFDRKNKKFLRYEHDEKDSNSINDNNIFAICEDREGFIWVGTLRGGVNKLDPETRKFIHYKNDPENPQSLSGNFVRALLEDAEGNLWIGTQGGGLNLLVRKSNTFKRFTNDETDESSLSNNIITALFQDSDENLWIGTDGGGVNLYNKNSGSFYRYLHNPDNQYSISTNAVYAFYEDEMGILWVGNIFGGININYKDHFKFFHYSNYGNSNSLNYSLVLCFLEDENEKIWIGTDGGGLNLFDRKNDSFTHYKHDPFNKNSISGNVVKSIFLDRGGYLWIGTFERGLNKYDRKTNRFKNYFHDPNDPNSVANNNIWAIFEDSRKNMWIGTNGGGLDLFDREKETFTHFKHNDKDTNSISNDVVTAIYEDTKKNLWIGTRDGGLNLLDRDKLIFTHYPYKSENSSVFKNDIIIRAISEDSKGNLLIGSEGSGLVMFNIETRTFISYGIKDGLPNDVVHGIMEDESGNIWFSTNNGLSRFDPLKKVFRNYDVGDGLQSQEFIYSSYYKAKNGDMFFGGINGFNVFNPENLKENRKIPEIVITDFKIFNKNPGIGGNSPLKEHISLSKEIVLTYLESMISFEFASLNYISSKKNLYSYKLVGFDKEWSAIGPKNTATYTNLDPGEYLFKVKGSNNDGIWNKKGTSIKIIITPPFWQTWWFKLLVIVLMVGIVFLFFKLRINNIKKQKTALEKQVKVRTNELQLANEELTKQKAEILEQKTEILDQKDQLQEYYREIKDSIKAAQILQKAILPSEQLIKKHLPDSFILNKPKDIVSGDFYWFHVKDNKIIMALVDCTGHGVSGAFLSINCHHLLNQAIIPYQHLVASEILDRLNEGIINGLNQSDDEYAIMDGMDIALVILDKENRQLQFAGANNPLYVIRERKIIQVKADRFSIGRHFGNNKRFTNNKFDLQGDDMVYLFSDGYADQIGGLQKDEKFMYNRFREVLLKIAMEKTENQKSILNKTFENWKGKVEQLDDILIIGFKST